MPTERIETVVVGAGQAGLSISHHLRQLDQEHVVLERGRVAERWRSERWDSLCFQSPNWNMKLAGWARLEADPDADPNGFSPLPEVVHYLERYAGHIGAPLRSDTPVLSLRRKSGAERLLVQTPDGEIEARHVVVATGPYQANAPTPPLGRPSVLELHSTQYRNPQQLPPGAVLIVGSGNSGVQIADEINAAGRRCFLAVSSHERAHRRYRGKDCLWWLIATGSADATLREWRGARLSRLMTGVRGGYDMDLRRLAADGVTLVGRVAGADAGVLSIADDLRASVAHGDESLIAFNERCDAMAHMQGLDLPPPEPAAPPLPDPPALLEPIRRLDLAREDIRSVVWCNGARPDFAWVDLPVFGDMPGPKRMPLHERGITAQPGLYFLGLPWLHKWKSAFLFGADDDAAHIAAHIASAAKR